MFKLSVFIRRYIVHCLQKIFLQYLVFRNNTRKRAGHITWCYYRSWYTLIRFALRGVWEIRLYYLSECGVLMAVLYRASGHRLVLHMLIYHITYGPGVPEHRAGNRINALVQYRFLFPRFCLITLLQTGHKWRHLWWRYYKQCHISREYIGRRQC